MRIAPRERLVLIFFGVLAAFGGLLVLREAGALPTTLRWFTGLLLLVTGIVVAWVAFLPCPHRRPKAIALLATERLSLFPLVLVGFAVLWTGLGSGAVALPFRVLLGVVAGGLTLILVASIATGTRLLPDLVGEARLRQLDRRHTASVAAAAAPPSPVLRSEPTVRARPESRSDVYDEG